MKPFSIYFPQFYPVPTNDAAWGKGFTDWSLVANANLRNLWQRRAPARGFYDGASPSVHAEQVAEARAASLGGFGVYHYWFYSHQELDRFERSLLQTPKSRSFPWFLIWASEGWSRRWLGDPTFLVNLAKEPSRADIEQHCDHLATCFDNGAYFRLAGKPLFAWYDLAHFTRPEQVVEQYRRCCMDRGFDIAAAQFVKNPFDAQYARFADISYLFEPRLFFGFQRVGRSESAKRRFDMLSRTLGEVFTARLLVLSDALQRGRRTFAARHFLEYLVSPQRQALVDRLSGTVQEVISPGWNNAPRYGSRFTSLENLPLEAFADRVRSALRGAHAPPLINAWNEWSEGAAIEPCAYLGRTYLEAIQQAVSEPVHDSPAASLVAA